MSVGECWFCGAPPRDGDQVRTDMHRDVEETFLGLHQEWKTTWVDVPRCRRCRVGHGVDQVAF